MSVPPAVRLGVLALLVGLVPPALLLWLSFRLEQRVLDTDLASRASAVAHAASAHLRPAGALLDALAAPPGPEGEEARRARIEAALPFGNGASGACVLDEGGRHLFGIGAAVGELPRDLLGVLRPGGERLARGAGGSVLLARRLPSGFGIVRLDAEPVARSLAPIAGGPGRSASLAGVAGPVLAVGPPGRGAERPAPAVRLLGALLGAAPRHASAAAPDGAFSATAVASEEALLSSWSASLPLFLLVGLAFGATCAGLVVGLSTPAHDLTQQLGRAVRQGEFEVHYQPVVDVRSGRCVGAEALLRWRHARKGLLSPDLFIALAEETGLVVPMTEQLLRRVALELPDGLPDPDGFHVSINLAGAHLSDPGTAERIAGVFAGSRLAPSQLVFELTERELVEDRGGAARTVIESLQAWGARVALDDFGTGWSNMATLRRFRLDALKLDKTFVDGIGTGSVAETVVDSMIDLGHRLEMTVVAEGVERAEQRDYLVARGVHLFQGYLFSEPLPLRELAAFVHGREAKHSAPGPELAAEAEATA